MAAPDLEIIVGTTFGFSVDWKSGGEVPEPVDLSGCTARFQISSGDGKKLLESTTENGCVDIIDPANGVIQVQVKPHQTVDCVVGDWSDAAYELRVYFASGDVYSLLRGSARLLVGAIHD